MKVPPTAQLDVLAGVAATEAVSSNEYKVCDIICLIWYTYKDILLMSYINIRMLYSYAYVMCFTYICIYICVFVGSTQWLKPPSRC